MKYRYVIRDAEAGNSIDEFSTFEQAQEMLLDYERTDMKEGDFKVGFYEIYDLEKSEVLESESLNSFDYEEFLENNIL